MLSLLVHIFQIGIIALIGGIILRFPFIGLLSMIVLIPGNELTRLNMGRTVIFFIGLFTFVAWVLQILIKRNKIRISVVPTVLAVLWLLWGLTSTFWAQNQGTALGRAIDLSQLIAFFILIQNLIVDKKRLKIALFVYFISTVVYSFLAIGIGMSTGIMRVSLGAGQNPAQFAEAIGLGVLLVPYMFRWSKRFLWKLLLTFGSAGIIFAVLLTGTRAVWVGLAMAVVLTWFVSKGKAIRTKTLLIGIIIVAAGFITAIYFHILSNYTTQRIVTLFNLQANRGGAGRTNIWRVGLEMVRHNLFVGVGLQNFPVRFENYAIMSGLNGAYAVHPGRDPHNIFLSVQSELGLIGLFIFMFFLVSVLRMLLRNKKDSITAMGMLIFFFIIVSGFAITLLYRKYTWFALGIVTTIPMVITNEKN